MTVASDTSYYFGKDEKSGAYYFSIGRFFVISPRKDDGMAKFNEKNGKLVFDATSYEGGDAIQKTLKAEWINLLFSCMLEDGCYESAEKRQNRYIDMTDKMIEEYGPKFVSKTALFARNELGMRSISQLTAAMLNNCQFDGKADFYSKFFHRADDVAEVFAAVNALGSKLSHGLVKGAKLYIECLGEYDFGKYTLKNRRYNWFDIINITHAHSSAIDRYKSMDGKINSPDTWENAISNTSPENKESEWRRLVVEHKLGYLALIRNLRNICSCSFCNDSFINEYLAPQVRNSDAIHKSLVFPYQIVSAAVNAGVNRDNGFYYAYELDDFRNSIENINPSLLSALSDAFKISVDNIPDFSNDRVAILLDVSGSMNAPMSSRSNISIKMTCAAYAVAVALKCDNVDIVKFGDNAKKFNFHKNGNVFTQIAKLCDNDYCGYGTMIGQALKMLDGRYDKLFIFSDMQVMDRVNSWSDSNPFKDISKISTSVYSFDLGMYHTSGMDFSNPNVIMLTGLNDKIFKILPLVSGGTEGILDYIDENY